MAWIAFADDAPRPSPPLTLLRVGAQPVKLAQYRGKVVALAFILTTCSHCQQLTTEFNLLAKEYSARPVQFLVCAFNEDAIMTMPEFLERYQPPFPVGYSSRAAVLAFLQRTIIDPRPVYVPYLVMIDRAGMIRGEFGGRSDLFRDPMANLRTELNRLLR